MAAKLTQQQAIERMSKAHNNFYTYNSVEYKGAFVKLTVDCPLHGPFDTTFTNHTHKTNPRGCPVCGGLRRYQKKTKPASAFLDKAIALHGDRYDYSLIQYKNTHTKVEIICKEHGPFWQSPEKHMAKRGCPICAGRGIQTPDRFIIAATKVHGTIYDYSLITQNCFKSEGSKVPIVCAEHGKFYQNYSNHLQGQGCAKCAKYGFCVGKSGTLYVMVDNERLKVGITNRSIEIRLKEINKPDGNFKVLKTYVYEDGFICLKHETEILKFLRKYYENTQGTFDGVTESFEGVDANSVISFIEELRENEEESHIRASI